MGQNFEGGGISFFPSSADPLQHHIRDSVKDWTVRNILKWPRLLLNFVILKINDGNVPPPPKSIIQRRKFLNGHSRNQNCIGVFYFKKGKKWASV